MKAWPANWLNNEALAHDIHCVLIFFGRMLNGGERVTLTFWLKKTSPGTWQRNCQFILMEWAREACQVCDRNWTLKRLVCQCQRQYWNWSLDMIQHSCVMCGFVFLSTVLSLRAADVNFEEVIRKFGRERIVRYWAQIFVKMEKIMIAHNQKNNMNTDKLTAGCTTGFMVVVDGRDYLLRHILSIKCKHMFWNWIRFTGIRPFNRWINLFINFEF